MRSSKANIAGLLYPLQQAEMKAILAGAWPPLKPLPVFKYETSEYRATIDFDKRRGEWVCRKTSLPSNKVQELRGGLREITMALPHGEEGIFNEEAEQPEQELEKDTNRRLQAIHEWRKNYESGALYCELRDYLPESRRTELDDGLRLSLTARQLQFNAKNVAYVFDALSTAGGRFATLIELAKHTKAKQGIASKAKDAAPEAEPATDQDRQRLGSSPRECAGVPNRWSVEDEGSIDGDEFPAVSIKNVLPERDPASWAERIALDTGSQQPEIETSEIVETDSSSGGDHSYQEGQHSAAFTGFVGQSRTGQSSPDGIEGARARFPALEISASQIAVFGISLLVALAFAVALTVGGGPLGSRFREAPKSMLAVDTKPPAQPDGTDESTSPAAASPAGNPNDTVGARSLNEVAPVEGRSKESDSALKTETQESPKTEDHIGAMGPIAPRSTAPQWLTPKIILAPHLPRSSAILVTLPSKGSQPFRVSFPEKAVAATSAFAMTSQLSVLVSGQPRAAMAYKPARLEAGELVSFVWPRYPSPRDGYGSAETIRVRATIGQLGQVLEVKFVSGSISLLPATTRAMRQWSYRAPLLDKKPVQSQQDVTIEFRPSPYSSKVSSQHPFHK